MASSLLSAESRRKSFRKLVYLIHLYGGLLCAPYLLVIGLTSLDMNHGRSLTSKASRGTHTTVHAFTPKTGLDDRESATWVRDDMNMKGPILKEIRRLDAETIEFKIYTPGKDYVIQAQMVEGRARVQENRHSLGAVFNKLHGQRGLVNSSFVTLFVYYGRFTGLLAIFSCLSGVYLWLVSERDRVSGLLITFTAMAGLLCFLGWIIWRG